MQMINVAIDGPSGAGKSTISKAVANSIGYLYIDTGAMYRTVAYKALSEGIDLHNADSLKKMLAETTIDIRHFGGAQHMISDGSDVTDFIRTPEVSAAASAVAAIPLVREWLLELQRKLADKNNCIMDGRDIGTTILPNADVKIFLTASAEKRAERRYAELREKGMDVRYDDVLSDMKKRDANDSGRKCSPLKVADGAVILDTSNMNLDEAVEAVKSVVVGKAEM